MWRRAQEVEGKESPVRLKAVRPLWSIILRELKIAFWILFPFWAVTTFGITATAVDGVSMMPTLRSGEYVWIPKYEVWLHRLGIGAFKRGDIVIFKPPLGAPNSSYRLFGLWNYRPFFIKRIVAIGGDRVTLDRGQVRVNGRAVFESISAYWKGQGCWDRESSLANFARSDLGGIPIRKELWVPKGEYFVMGDNRSPGGSEDSRLFGTVSLNDIFGRAKWAWLPPSADQNGTYSCEGHPVAVFGEIKNNLRVFP